MTYYDTGTSAPSPLMSVQVDVSGSVALVTVVGECDTSEAGRLAQALEEARARASEIHIELSGLTFLDSGALQVLYRAATDPEGGRSRLVLIGPTPGIRRVLQIARLDSCLEIRERPEASTLPAGDLHPPLEADTDRSQLDARQAVPDAV